MSKWLSEHKGMVLIRCHIQPGASKNEVAGAHGDRMKIRIKAPPVDGKANKELIAFLSKVMGVPKGSLSILRGLSSKQKDVLCEEGDLERISECFE